MKLPAFQFYPADWRKDPGVQALSYHDRGVWFEILCLMHESEQRGKLTLNGRPMPEDALARLLGLDKQNLTKVISTLLEYGVARKEAVTGIIYNKRMVEDEKLRQIRAEVGQKGGLERVKREKEALLKQISSKEKPKGKQNSTTSFTTSTTKKEEEKEEKFAYYIGDQGFNLLYDFLKVRFHFLLENLQRLYPDPVFEKALTDFLNQTIQKRWKDEEDVRSHLSNYFKKFNEKNGESIKKQALILNHQTVNDLYK